MMNPKITLAAVALAMIAILGAAILLLGEDPKTPIPQEPSVDSPSQASEEPQAESPAARETIEVPSEGMVEITSTPDEGGFPAYTESAGDPSVGFDGRVIDLAGNPIEGVSILASSNRGSFFVQSFDGSSDDSRPRTDENGRFQIRHLKPGSKYFVRASHSEYIAGSYEKAKTADGIVDLGDLSLDPGAAVEGYVYGPNGAAVAGASVWARYTEKKSLDLTDGFDLSALVGSRKSTTTEEDGSFRLAGLNPGGVFLHADIPTMSRAQTDELSLEHGKLLDGVRITMGVGVNLAGTVVDDLGHPIAGAEVRLARGFSMTRPRNPKEGPKVKTDSEGRFVFDSLGTGRKTLVAEADGHATTHKRGIDAATSTGLVIELPRHGELKGIVHDSKTGDKVVAKFEVSLEKTQEAHFYNPRGAEANQDRDGEDNATFHLKGLAPGTYNVSIRAPGYSSGRSESIVVEPGRVTENVQVEVDIEAVLAGRVVDAQTGAPVAGAQVQAKPFNPDGGETEVWATASYALEAPMPIEYRAIRGGATTDEDGRFRLDGLAAGDYLVAVKSSSHSPLEDGPHHVELGIEIVDLELAMKVGGHLEGRVLDIEGRPVEGQSIVATGPAPKKDKNRATTDENGVYSLKHLTPGEYAVARRDKGGGFGFHDGDGMVMIESMGGPQSKAKGIPVTIVEGQTANCDFSDAMLGNLGGTLTSLEGPVEGARVELRKPDQPFGSVKSSKTDERGEFRLERVEPGDYQLVITPEHCVIPHREDVEISTGENTSKVRLPGGVIRGRVTLEESGEGVSGVRVSAKRLNEEESEVAGGSVMLRAMAFDVAGAGDEDVVVSFGGFGTRVTTDENGDYVLRYLPEGEFEISFAHSEFVAQSKVNCALGSDEEKKGVDGVVISGGTVTGLVRNAVDASALSQAIVTIATEGEPKVGWTGSDGRFEIKGVPAGDHEVSVRRFGFETWEGRVHVQIGQSEEIQADLQKK